MNSLFREFLEDTVICLRGDNSREEYDRGYLAFAEYALDKFNALHPKSMPDYKFLDDREIVNGIY